MEGSSVEQNLHTIGERELAIAQVLTFLAIFSLSLVLVLSEGELDRPVGDDGVGIRRGGEELEVGDESLPLRDVEVLLVDQVRGELQIVDGRDASNGGTRLGQVLLYRVMKEWARVFSSAFLMSERLEQSSVRTSPN